MFHQRSRRGRRRRRRRHHPGVLGLHKEKEKVWND